jgi:hypothetical protein
MNAILALYRFSAKRKWSHGFLLCALALLAVFLHPVDALMIRHAPSSAGDKSPGPLFAAGAPLGRQFTTEYLHSVQLTPVQDIYRIVNGRIWSWQERVQSHNAGLPFSRPPFGRFRMDHPWMVIEGGRQSWREIHLRVGNAELGRNLFTWGRESPPIELYKRFPGRRLRLEVERVPLIALLRAKRFADRQGNGSNRNPSLPGGRNPVRRFFRILPAPEESVAFSA